MSDPASDRETATRSDAQPADQIVSSALRLYRRYPSLFLALGAVVIIPFDLIVLAVSGRGPYLLDSGGSVHWLVQVGDWVWITPLISALHIHAVAAIRRGDQPHLRSVAATGFSVLPTVIPATVASGVLIGVGSVAAIVPGLSPGLGVVLVIPGLVLTLRFIVVGQVASIEQPRWLRPLARSWELTARQWGHVIGFLLLAGLVLVPLFLAIWIPLHGHPTTPASFCGGLFVHIVLASFVALATALLYFDLQARKEAGGSVSATSPQAA
jgi:hypothetical protein